MENKIDSILSLIDATVQKDYAVAVWVPSLINTPFDTLYFKPLNIEQQSELLKSTMYREDLYNTNFIKTFYKILETNLIEHEDYTINVGELTILDKIFIAIKLRSSMNNFYFYKNSKIDLESIYTELKNTILHKNELITPTKTTINNIEISCSLPSLKTELLCELERDVINIEDIKLQIQNIIIDLINNEIAKFCDSIHIENTESIMLGNFNFAERKNIVNKLPVNVLDSVLQYTINYKNIVEKALSITVRTEEGTEIEEILQINGAFFATQ